MKPYRLAVDWEAVNVLLTLEEGRQRSVTDFLARLRDTPFRAGELQERDSTGRINQVALLDDVLLHYWPDHAERLVRVTRIEVV